MHEKLLPLLFFVRLFVFLLVGFGLISVFVRSKCFCKKKMGWLEIVLIASFTILLACTPINLLIECLFVRTYLYLWSSVRISSFYENLSYLYFLSHYENKLVYDSHHLNQVFYHQNLIMIFCWFRMFQVYVCCLKFFSFFV